MIHKLGEMARRWAVFPRGGRGPKVFCIGRNKTGTTSMGALLESLGYRVAPQRPGELMLRDWAVRDFRKTIEFCKRFDAFQDAPFSWEFTYQAMDAAFPGSKFILTTRGSAEDWYDSLVRFHAKIMGVQGVPTAEHLKAFPYVYKGWMWESAVLKYGIDERSLYDRDIYIDHYNTHNKQALHYFMNRPESLLALRLDDPDAADRIAAFLSAEASRVIIPHINRSR